jgi:hypothetical protein
MSKDKTLEESKKSLKDNLQSIQDRDKPELNEDQKKKLKNNIEKVFMQALLDKGKPKDILDKVLKDKDKDEFFRLFSPWHQKRGKKLIKDFVEIVNQNSTDDFSWLDILGKDKRWEKLSHEETKNEIEDKSKHVNMRYQIPTHFHGDIDNAVILHCLENPKGHLGDWYDDQIDTEFAGENLDEFYIKSASKRKEKSKILEEIIRERYQLEKSPIEENLKKQIINIIYSCEESALGREIEHIYKQDEYNKYYNFDFDSKKNKTELLKDYYYFKESYSHLIQTDQNLDFKRLKNEKEAVKKIADKICNVEIYPFSCKEPKLGNDGIGREILLKSDLSRLGAYIVLRRIYRYLNDETDKPVIVFRKYDRAWEKLLRQIFLEVKDQDFNDNNFLEKLENNFFYCQLRAMGGGITSGNVISVTNYKEYLNLKKDSTLTKLELDEKYLKMRKDAFKEISSLLPRIEVDKKTKNR